MKTFVFAAAVLAVSGAASADPVVATSVRQGNTIVTTTARGVYTTEIQSTGPSTATSQTRFQSHPPQGFAARSQFKAMTH